MSDPGFKGTGWAFPPSFGRGGATVATVSGDEDIVQSLHIILATETGERVMRPKFGCNLSAFVFEEIDQGLISRIIRTVSDAILHYEPRVVAEKVDAVPDTENRSTLLIRVLYRSRITNARYNLVYPFYLDEAAAGPAPGGG